MTGTVDLSGRQVLVVEDEFFLANDIAQTLVDFGASVLGPVGRIDDALDLIGRTAHLDGVVLDLNLSGEMSFAVADALVARGVALVFTTGYDPSVIPARFDSVPRIGKPVDAAKVVQALFV